MDKLVDRLNTKYLVSHFAGEVHKVLQEVTEIDLAGARICFDVMAILNSVSHSGRVLVRDTEDPERDAYFQENRRRGELQRSITKLVPLPIPRSKDDIISTIQSLKTDCTYELTKGREVAGCAFAVLAQAARPDVTLDLGGYVKEVFTLIQSTLFPTTSVWDEFYVSHGDTFIVKKPLPGEYNKFLDENLAIPTDFGKENLYKKSEWSRCLDLVAYKLDSSFQSQSKKIRDYL